MRILMAEDGIDIATLYKKALEINKHSVLITSNGKDCLKNYLTTLKNLRSSTIQTREAGVQIKDTHSSRNATAQPRTPVDTNASPYDAVILDYSMPGMNGMEVAKEILSAYPHQRIIFASAYVKETLEQSVKELKQVVELMQKPFALKQLTDMIKDTEAFEELRELNVDVDRIKGDELTHEEIFDLLDKLKRIQRNRTF
jgi:CheY-like chemotaxis protein